MAGTHISLNQIQYVSNAAAISRNVGVKTFGPPNIFSLIKKDQISRFIPPTWFFVAVRNPLNQELYSGFTSNHTGPPQSQSLFAAG